MKIKVHNNRQYYLQYTVLFIEIGKTSFGVVLVKYTVTVDNKIADFY